MSKVLDLDKFIYEVDKLIEKTWLYDELYCDEDSLKVLNTISIEAFSLFRSSLHDDIVSSCSRLLYDGLTAHDNGEDVDLLSFYNLRCKYQKYLDEKLEKKRKVIAKIKDKIPLKNYRNQLIAHANKPIHTGYANINKHNIDSENLIELLMLCRGFIFDIRIKIAQENSEKSIPVSNNKVCRSGIGKSLITRLKKI